MLFPNSSGNKAAVNLCLNKSSDVVYHMLYNIFLTTKLRPYYFEVFVMLQYVYDITKKYVT